MGYKPPPELVYALARPLTRSLRVHIFGGENLHQGSLASPTRSVVMCFWHQNLLLALAPAHGLRLAALASMSGDGAIIADFLERIGIRPVRGSSARGGARAAKELTEVLHDRYHLAIAIDGPRGPFRQAKAGTIELVRRQGVPIVPVGVRSTRELSMHSWDRFRLPLPGAHVAMVFGAPIFFPPEDPDEATLAARVKQVSQAINAVDAVATMKVGKRDLWPIPRYLRWMGR